ncbi:MAG: LysR substrate-binding domain-containing protein [Pseudomonadota bacterium]
MSEVRHLRALQAFDAAATHSNLSRAAESLGVTHGAVSRQIKQLEEYVGTPLLYRHSGGVEKTIAGERLHVATQQAFSLLSSGVREVRRTRDSHSVSISLSSSLAIKWLVPRLPLFRTQYPGIRVFLDTNDEIVDFDNSDVDIALRYDDTATSGLHCERLLDEEFFVAASPKLVGEDSLPMKPKAVAKLPLLLDRFNPAWEKWANSVGLADSHFAPSTIEFRDSAVLIAAACDGQGVALARRILLKEDLDSGRLVRLDSTSVSLNRKLYFVCREGEQHKSAIRTFRDWLFILCENEL